MCMIQRLREYGADVDGALERFMADEELFVKCIELFTEDENFKLLEDAIAKKDYKTAFEAAHTLKGVSGNLGITPVYESLSVLVETLRSKGYENIEDEYREVVELVKEFLAII